MNRNGLKLLVFVGMFSLPVGVFAQPASPSAKSNTESDALQVRKLYRNAQTLFAAGNAEGARKLLLEAWAIRHNSDVALSLGQMELELRLYRVCAEHLDYAIRNFSTIGSEKALESAKQALLEASAHVGQVRITANRDGAEIQLDGQTIGVSPLQSLAYVEPGRHSVEVRQGNDIATETFEVRAGRTHEMNAVLQPASVRSGPDQTAASTSGMPPSNTPASLASNEKDQRSVVPVVIGGAAFVIGVSAAIGFRLKSDSEYSDGKTLLAKVGAGGCAGANGASPDCATLHDSNRSGDTDRNWSTVGIVTAITALAGTSAYLLWPHSENHASVAERATWRIIPTINPQRTGLVLTGEY